MRNTELLLPAYDFIQLQSSEYRCHCWFKNPEHYKSMARYIHHIQCMF